jgi:hypothetical protein
MNKYARQAIFLPIVSDIFAAARVTWKMPGRVRERENRQIVTDWFTYRHFRRRVHTLHHCRRHRTLRCRHNRHHRPHTHYHRLSKCKQRQSACTYAGKGKRGEMARSRAKKQGGEKGQRARAKDKGKARTAATTTTRHRIRHVHANGASVEVLAVHPCDRGVCFGLVSVER